ncbi:hypothetical protein ACFFMN_35875 [Planobispora siamensis]|uniref:Aspartate carbamoyltransferase n=1 Tax=Planobispora siamensis TaxID=936338 RepID=A0A8J3SM81_9ACTN|nr:hypothetical protein [Planobispora siamensis]GIH95151.1 hypothetical protein Psi01_57810 [Planobispora siamensis]
MSGRNRVAVAAALAALAVVAVGLTALSATAGDARQREVADRGRTVMPFDLDRTTHRFTKTDGGGVQTVVSDDPSDAGQIRLIREHLTEEAARFGRGDFGDPASIHGPSMPGLRELSTGYRDIEVAYAELPDGARLTYTVSDPALVAALHSWFDAQVGDHGEHAEHG